MTVGFDLATLALNQAGEGRYVDRIVRALAARDDIALRPLATSVRRPRNLLQRVALQLAYETIYYPLAIGRAARRVDADLIHYPRQLVPPQPRTSQPTVVTVHDLLALRHPELFSPVISAHHRLLVPPLVRRANAVITNSQYSKDQVVETLQVPPDRVHVTHFGVDERFRPLPRDEGALRERYGITKPYVLAVGTLEPRKNLKSLIRAFERLGEDRGGHELVLVGGRGWRNAEFDALLAEVRSPVRLTGRVDDGELVRLLSGASCLAFPSLYEGFGFPPLEAMACGTPVITSNRASLPEVVGDAGVMVEPEDVDALRDALARVIGDQAFAEDLRARGLARRRLFTWERCAERTAQVYRAALGR